MEEFKIGDKVRSKMDRNLIGTISEICWDHLYDGRVEQSMAVKIISDQGYVKYKTFFDACDIEKIDEEKENKEMTSYKVGDIVDHPLYNESIIVDISEFETGYISIMPLTGYRRGQTILVSIDNVKQADSKLIISIDDYNKMNNEIERLRKEAYIAHDTAASVAALALINNFSNDNLPEIKEVLYHKPATIIFWKDGTKTVVKVQNKEKYDKEKGFVMAYLKKILGNEGNYYEEVKRWT